MKLLRTHLSRPPNPWSYPLVSFVLLAVLITSWVGWQSSEWMGLLSAGRDDVFTRHEYWRLWTSTAMHADIRHFLSNSIFFFIFGFLLHSYFGLWVFPTLCLALGGVVNAATLYFYPEHSVLIGASGVVYLMGGFWATLFFFIERKDRALKRFGVTLCVSLMLFFPASYEPEVSYLAHATGFLLGMISGIVYFYLNRIRLQLAEVWKAPEIDEDLQQFAHLDLVPEPLENETDPRAV